jgi:hypothetical protein
MTTYINIPAGAVPARAPKEIERSTKRVMRENGWKTMDDALNDLAWNFAKPERKATTSDTTKTSNNGWA